jgi:uncharacterized membrane protein YeaQ/YmgE (transglycosylase-associated protein family)
MCAAARGCSKTPHEALDQECDVMQQPDLMPVAQQWAHTILVWIGFGTVTGLMAKAIMPGRDPGGPIATLLMGIGGSVIGCGLLSYAYEGAHISPISPIGFVVATAGAFLILFFYKLLSGRVIYEPGEGVRRPWYQQTNRGTYRGRRAPSRAYEE